MFDQPNNSSVTSPTSISGLDSLAMAVMDALYQGDEARLEKAIIQLNPQQQAILRLLITCWRTDTYKIVNL